MPVIMAPAPLSHGQHLQAYVGAIPISFHHFAPMNYPPRAAVGGYTRDLHPRGLGRVTSGMSPYARPYASQPHALVLARASAHAVATPNAGRQQERPAPVNSGMLCP